jgi:hypothetical protein
MKKLILISLISAGLIVACQKDKKETNEKKCPVVAANLVPQAVKDSFMHRYPTDTVKIWFNKDSVGYCAYFISSGIEKLAQFSNSGNFVKEELESENENEHDDSTVVGKAPAGCECEVHDNKD